MSDYYTPTIQVTIEMDNAAFDDAPEYEVSRILRELSRSIEIQGFDHCPNNLKDINGNTVGAFSYNHPGE